MKTNKFETMLVLIMLAISGSIFIIPGVFGDEDEGVIDPTRSKTLTLKVNYNGTPVQGAAVYHDGFDTYNGRYTFDGYTDSNGCFYIKHNSNEKAGGVVIIKNWGNSVLSASSQFPASTETGPIFFNWTSKDPIGSGSIDCTVYNQSYDKLPNADIYLDGIKKGSTDSDGEYKVNNVNSGWHFIDAVYQGTKWVGSATYFHSITSNRFFIIDTTSTGSTYDPSNREDASPLNKPLILTADIPVNLESGEEKNININVQSYFGQFVQDVDVTLSASQGYFDPSSGKTDSLGNLQSIFTAPITPDQLSSDVNISISKNGYQSTWTNEKILINSKDTLLLTSPLLDPIEGDDTTVFSYEVTYSDPDGAEPSLHDVIIDGSAFEMDYIDGSLVSGATYRYTTKLSEGEHNYRFHFEDSVGNIIYLPESVLFEGPNVLDSNALNEIAILVIGTKTDDDILDNFIEDVNHLYNTLLIRGYSKDDIYLLAPRYNIDSDNDGLPNDVDAISSSNNLDHAIRVWALLNSNEKTHLFIYLRDHGSSQGFNINENEILQAELFGSWVDYYRSNSNTNKITITISSCHAGVFFEHLSHENTIVIAKSPAENSAMKGFDIPFSQKLREGQSIYDSYLFAKEKYYSELWWAILRGIIGEPQIDDNGNGLPNENIKPLPDGELSSKRYIGVSLEADVNPPTISLMDNNILVPEGSIFKMNISVIDEINVDTVFAEVVKPGFKGPFNESYKLPLLYLNQVGNTQYFNGLLKLDKGMIGDYFFIIWAVDNKNNIAGPEIMIVNSSKDTDMDMIPDIKDYDDDNDGWNDTLELELGSDPLDNESYPLDTDHDRIPDLIDDDDDNDGWNDTIEIGAGFDPLDSNSVPEDFDGDRIADFFDDDDDNDGYPDIIDAFPHDSSEWMDFDNDGTGDNLDTDDDNDGIPDEWELRHGLNITFSGDSAEDPDEDGLTNLLEYEYSTDPNVADSDGDGFSDKEEVDKGTDPNDDSSFPNTEIVDDDGDRINYTYLIIGGFVVIIVLIAMAGYFLVRRNKESVIEE